MKEATKGGFLEAAEWADAIAQESGLPFRDV
jgi:argininosuccinate lyase